MAGVPCELRCTDLRLLERAAHVLRGSLQRRPAEEDPAALQWQIAPLRVSGDGSPRDASTRAIAPAAHDEAVWLIRRLDTDDTWTLSGIDAALRCVEFGSVAGVLDGAFGIVTLHGALLDRGGRGLLILGPCESGKSTLAAALWRGGWTLLGDDVAVTGPDGRAAPLPRRVSLRQGSRTLLGEALWTRVTASPSCSETGEGCLFHPSEVDGRRPPSLTRVAGIVFLARRGVGLGPAEVSPINGAQALLALAPYSNVIRRAGLAAALERLQPLAASAPAFDLGRGPLPRMIDAIERHVSARWAGTLDTPGGGPR